MIPPVALIDCSSSARDGYVGAVANGSAFYRDVSPGHYHIAPESFGRDFNQDRNVDLSPSQQLSVRIVSLDIWRMSVSGCKNCARDAFYAWLCAVSPPRCRRIRVA
jgi:hypothetical protein